MYAVSKSQNIELSWMGLTAVERPQSQSSELLQFKDDGISHRS